MKRNTFIIALVVIALGVLAVILINQNGSGTLKPELKDFAVQDTASIDKIFMVRKSNEQVILSREEGSWMVNDTYEVRPDAISLLLKTIQRLRVKAPVSKSAMDYVLKMMATRNTKVEIFSKGKLIKTYYVGGPTQDQVGTFMMMEGSSVPFVVSIPGFAGYLSSRYFTEEDQWRTPLLLSYDYKEISQIRSVNNDDPSQSFILSSGNDKLMMTRLENNEQASSLDTLAVRFFISNHERVACEFFADLLEPEIKDSLAAAQPFHVLEITDIYGKKTKIEAHRRAPLEQADPDEPVYEYDRERMYARINDKVWVVIQYFVFDPLFHEFDFFLPQN